LKIESVELPVGEKLMAARRLWFVLKRTGTDKRQKEKLKD
jgi:hypothetical protein